MLLWTCIVNKHLFETLLSIIFSMYPEVEFVEHMVILFLIFLRNHHMVFNSGYTILHYHQQCLRDYNFSTSSPMLVTFCFLDISHPNGCTVVWTHVLKSIVLSVPAQAPVGPSLVPSWYHPLLVLQFIN